MKLFGETAPDGQEGYLPGAWDEVRRAYMDGHISEKAYEVLRAVVPFRDRTSEPLRQVAIGAVHDMEAVTADPSVEQYVDVVLGAVEERLARYERQLKYAARPTMGLPGGVDPAEFARTDATEQNVRLALSTCIQGAQAVLDADQQTP